MAIKRAQAERILIDRCGSLLIAAGLDGVTHDGSNPSLNDPCLYGLLRLGYTSVTNLQGITDDDLSIVANDEFAAFLDLAELRCLYNSQGAFLEQVDITIGPRQERFSQRTSNLKKRIEMLEDRIERDHGVGVGELEIGNMNLNFQTKGDDDIYGVTV